jgi:mono/diheme cytochrome c family protein
MLGSAVMLNVRRPALATIGACLALACGGAPPADDPPSMSGEELYSQCATCHEQDGTGLAAVYPPLAGSDIVNGPLQTLIRIVLGGLEGPITVKGERYDGTMPPWGGGPELNDADAAALLTYVRSAFGNRAGLVTATDVAREREASAGRIALWTAAELGLH